MTFLPQPRDATGRRALLDDAPPLLIDRRGVSEDLCEAILKSLGRDDRLRREYVRLRWHGLIAAAGPSYASGGEVRVKENVRLRPRPRRRPLARELAQHRRPAKLALSPRRLAHRLTVDDPIRLRGDHGRPRGA
jgi:hypothetical protein